MVLRDGRMAIKHDVNLTALIPLISPKQEEREKSPRYQAWLREQNILEEFRLEEEARLQLERQQQWEHNEKIAQQQWIEHQAKMLKAREEKVKQEMRIREEWEFEQKKIQETEEEKKRREAEKIKKLEELMRQIDDFIKHGGEIPESVNISTETNPDKPLCPFFAKTGACRFSDRCSRNHPRPGISHVLLIPNFYTHFGLQQSMLDEYDTDLMLEYEDSETYQHFKEFYEDVVPEFESFGRVVQFKVCCNYEPHLRGNVYVEYSSTRDAVAAFQKLQGRYYGGRQLNVEFTSIASWKSALCGLFFKKRCPKGRSCNFLHVFRNPKNAFSNADHHTRKYLHASSLHSQSRSTSRSPSRRKLQRNKEDREHWRWSESPEPAIHQLNGDSKHKEHGSSPRRRRDKISVRLKEKSRANRRSESRSRRRSRSRSRSWSRDRNTSSRRSTSHRKERKRKKSHSKSELED